ncbi:MAG: hypothetical protein KA020_14830, partial [Planctomycetes bacterium]|nr:hypothetical protein [Planctomycetota bacterium]
IPTTTVAVTRGADLLTRALTGPEGTALSTQGTMVVEFSFLGGGSGSDANGRGVASIDSNSTSERHMIYNRAGVVGTLHTDGGSDVAAFQFGSAASTGTVVRYAMTWALNSINNARDGVAGTRDTGCTMPTVDRVFIGTQTGGAAELFGLIYGWTIYDDAKTDAELQALTTPTTNRNQSRLTLGLGLGL